MTPTGYATIPRAVIARIGEIGPVAFAVFAVLAGHADEAGTCWPSLDTLARMIGRSTRTVRSALRTLEADGLIEGTRRQRDTTIYRILDRQSVAGQEPLSDRQSVAGQEFRPAIFDRLDRQPVAERTNTRERTPKPKATDRQSVAGQRFDPLAVDLPFESVAFRAAWTDFAEMRSEKKRPLTDRAAKIVLRKLTAWGEAGAIESLEASTVSEWQGIFEPKNTGKSAAGERKCRVPTDEELANWTPYGGNGHEH